MNREHQNLWKLHNLGELAHTFDAIHSLKTDVHEHDLWFKLWDSNQRFLGARKSADAFTFRHGQDV